MKKNIVMPTTRQVWRDPAKRRWWRRLLALHDPVIYVIQDRPGYVYTAWIYGKPVGLFLPFGFRTDGASSPVFSWAFGFRPDGVLAIGSYFHDFYYRHGFLLAPNGARIFKGRGKAFADKLLADITAEVAGVDPPGRIAGVMLALFGWWAWWGGKRYRNKCSVTPDCIELYGGYGDD